MLFHLLRLLPTNTNSTCSNQYWQDVREYSHAFNSGLGQATVLEGDPSFADTFKPLFHSISHDMGLEGLMIPLNGSLKHPSRDQIYNYKGSLQRVEFENHAMRLTGFKTSNISSKNVNFSGYFKDLKVSSGYVMIRLY
jgi:hypothetical protein